MSGSWPAGKYAAIMADPPWHFRARTALQVVNWTSRRDAEKHYAVMGAPGWDAWGNEVEKFALSR